MKNSDLAPSLARLCMLKPGLKHQRFRVTDSLFVFRKPRPTSDFSSFSMCTCIKSRYIRVELNSYPLNKLSGHSANVRIDLILFPFRICTNRKNIRNEAPRIFISKFKISKYPLTGRFGSTHRAGKWTPCPSSSNKIKKNKHFTCGVLGIKIGLKCVSKKSIFI